MHRPHVEAAALLASAGHALFTDRQILLHVRRRTKPDDVRFALLPTFAPGVKPIVFPDLDALARKIQRDRGLAGLDMTEIEDLEFHGRPDAARGVQIWTTDASNSRDRFLGYAWLNGGGLEVLMSGLRRNRLVVIEEHEDHAEAA